MILGFALFTALLLVLESWGYILHSFHRSTLYFADFLSLYWRGKASLIWSFFIRISQMLYPLCSNNKQNLSYEIINVCKYISHIFQSLWYSELCLGISRSPKQRFVCYLRHKFHTKFAPRSPRRCLVCKSCWKLGRSAFPSPSPHNPTQPHLFATSKPNTLLISTQHFTHFHIAINTCENWKLNTLTSPHHNPEHFTRHAPFAA